MRKKLNYTKLLLAFILLVSIYSCTREDLLQQENPKETASASSARYASRSFWKEDDVYIGKVQQVFLKNANLERFNTTYGELYWNYAMSFGQFGEKYLLVPIVKKDKVVLLMQAVRKGDRLFFYEKTDPDMISFFQTAIYEKVTGFNETLSDGNLSKGLIYVCSTRTLEVGCDGEPGCVPYVKTVTDCGFQQGGTPPKGLDPWGDPNFGSGGGSDDDGYEYPDPPEEVKDPCSKIKSQKDNVNYKNKIEFLAGKTSETSEFGFRIDNPLPGSGQSGAQYQQLSNFPGSNFIQFPIFKNTYGMMHSHYEGLIPIFSPDDINNFIKLLINANNNGIPLDTVHMTVVNPDTTIYQLWGSNDIDVSKLSIFDQTSINQILNVAYFKDYELGKPNLSIADTQKNFLKFMKDKMNVSGVKLYSIDDEGRAQEVSLSGSYLIKTPCS